MAVTFANASNVQPLVNAEVVVATIAGPLDNLDAYVSGGAWADGTIVFYIYATVGAVRARVAIGIFGGPTAARITWKDPAGEPIEGSVHAGGTSYDLVVFAQPNQSYQPQAPAPINATFAGVDQGDVAADANVSGTASTGATIATAAGYNQFADVSARMAGLPGAVFQLLASCGAGSVEAIIETAATGGPDATAVVMKGVVLPAATSYRIVAQPAQPGTSFQVTASLSTYFESSAAPGGGAVALTGNTNGPSNNNTDQWFTVSRTDLNFVVATSAHPTGFNFIGLNGLTNNRTVTLNPAPADGDAVIVKDQDGSLAAHNIIIDGNGKTIDGAATVTMTNTEPGPFGSTTLVYQAAQNEWFRVANYEMNIPQHQLIVPDQAAASALLGLIDGDLVFTLKQRAEWRFVAGPALTPATGQVINSASGGSLMRTNYADPLWRWKVTDVYIDPSNVTGIANDENQAFFGAPQVGNARQPLLTWRELYLRTGSGNLWTSGDLVNGLFNIHVISDINIFQNPQTEQISTIDFLADIDTFPFIKGAVTATYVNTTLDVAGGFTAQNPATPAPGGTACQIKVTGQVWAPYVGYKVVFPATGAVATLLKDLGGGVARISQPVTLDTTPSHSNNGPTATNPANGDAVQIVLDTYINPGYWRSRFNGTSSNLSGLFGIQDCAIYVDSQSTLWSVDNAGAISSYGIVGFYGVSTQRVILHGANVIWNGCQFSGGYQSIAGETGGAIWGCGIVPLDNRNHVFLSGKADHAANRGVLDYSTYLQNAGVIAMGPLQLGLFSVWDAPISSDNTNGDGITIGQALNERVPSQTAFTASGVGIVWGSGSVGFGVHVQANSSLSYEVLPNLTGSEGDFAVGDGGVGRAWDDSAGAYTGNIFCTWANLALSIGAGGFGGNAHNLQQNAHVVPATNNMPGPRAKYDWDSKDLVQLDGTPVPIWTDNVAGISLTQATPAKQPTFNLSDPAYNHHHSVTFVAASAQYLASALAVLTLPQPYTIYIVGNDSGVGGVGQVYISHVATARYYYQNGAGGYGLQNGAALADPTVPSANPAVIALVCNGAGSKIYHTAKTAVATGNGGTDAWSDMLFGIFNDLVSDPLNGKLVRVVVVPAALDDPTVKADLQVLGTEYGIAIGP